VHRDRQGWKRLLSLLNIWIRTLLGSLARKFFLAAAEAMPSNGNGLEGIHPMQLGRYWHVIIWLAWVEYACVVLVFIKKKNNADLYHSTFL